MADSYSKAYSYAISLLAKKEYTRAKLHYKLNSYSLSTYDVEQLLNELEDKNYLSDKRFTTSYIHTCYRRGRGPLYIKNKLAQQGVQPDMIEEELSQCDLDWQESAKQVAYKKFNNLEDLSLTDKNTLQRFLYNRGFNGQLQDFIK